MSEKIIQLTESSLGRKLVPDVPVYPMVLDKSVLVMDERDNKYVTLDSLDLIGFMNLSEYFSKFVPFNEYTTDSITYENTYTGSSVGTVVYCAPKNVMLLKVTVNDEIIGNVTKYYVEWDSKSSVLGYSSNEYNDCCNIREPRFFYIANGVLTIYKYDSRLHLLVPTASGSESLNPSYIEQVIENVLSQYVNTAAHIHPLRYYIESTGELPSFENADIGDYVYYEGHGIYAKFEESLDWDTLGTDTISHFFYYDNALYQWDGTNLNPVVDSADIRNSILSSVNTLIQQERDYVNSLTQWHRLTRYVPSDNTYTLPIESTGDTWIFENGNMWHWEDNQWVDKHSASNPATGNSGIEGHMFFNSGYIFQYSNDALVTIANFDTIVSLRNTNFLNDTVKNATKTINGQSIWKSTEGDNDLTIESQAKTLQSGEQAISLQGEGTVFLPTINGSSILTAANVRVVNNVKNLKSSDTTISLEGTGNANLRTLSCSSDIKNLLGNGTIIFKSINGQSIFGTSTSDNIRTASMQKILPFNGYLDLVFMSSMERVDENIVLQGEESAQIIYVYKEEIDETPVCKFYATFIDRSGGVGIRKYYSKWDAIEGVRESSDYYTLAAQQINLYYIMDGDANISIYRYISGNNINRLIKTGVSTNSSRILYYFHSFVDTLNLTNTNSNISDDEFFEQYGSVGEIVYVHYLEDSDEYVDRFYLKVYVGAGAYTYYKNWETSYVQDSTTVFHYGSEFYDKNVIQNALYYTGDDQNGITYYAFDSKVANQLIIVGNGGSGGGGTPITVDSQFDLSSNNPLRNSVITNEFGTKANKTNPQLYGIPRIMSANAMQNEEVYNDTTDESPQGTHLATTGWVMDHVTTSVAQGSSQLVTSGGVYNALYAPSSDIAQLIARVEQQVEKLEQMEAGLELVETYSIVNNLLRSGTTSERPALTDVQAGFLYFDTTLNKPIWAVPGENKWVDVSGQTMAPANP